LHIIAETGICHCHVAAWATLPPEGRVQNPQRGSRAAAKFQPHQGLGEAIHRTWISPTKKWDMAENVLIYCDLFLGFSLGSENKVVWLLYSEMYQQCPKTTFWAILVHSQVKHIGVTTVPWRNTMLNVPSERTRQWKIILMDDFPIRQNTCIEDFPASRV
jgi:hypothetical protein